MHRKIDGWTVFADNEKSLDNFAAAHASGDSLADDDAFKDAMSGLPDDAALRGYLAAEPLSDLIQQRAAKSPDTQPFKSFSDSFGKLQLRRLLERGRGRGRLRPGRLRDDGGDGRGELRGGARRHASGRRAPLPLVRRPRAELRPGCWSSADEQSPEFGEQLDQFQQALGFNLKDDVLPLFSKEGAIAVYGGGESVPDVLFALRVDDEDKATELIDRLAAIAGLAGIDVRPLSVRARRGRSSRIRRTT